MKEEKSAAHNLLYQFTHKLIGLVFLAMALALALSLLLLSQNLVPKKQQGSLTQGAGLPPLPVSIASPKDDETVSGQVAVTLVNPLGRNFQKLEFWVDRQLEKKFDTTGAAVYDKLYEVNYKLDTTKYADGIHVLTVMGVDMEGIYQSFGVKVNFANKTALK